MEKKYVKGEQYHHLEAVQFLVFKAVHWELDSGEVQALLKVGIEGNFDAVSGGMSVCPTADELRRLAAMFAAAADDLDAHAAFIKARDEAKAGEGA